MLVVWKKTISVEVEEHRLQQFVALFAEKPQPAVIPDALAHPGFEWRPGILAPA